MATETPKKHFVFVYGTLMGMDKKFPAEFVGKGQTDEKFQFFGGGFPMALPRDVRPGLVTPGFIKGELFSVDDAVFTRLDSYEGYPEHYDRVETVVTCSMEGAGTLTENAWMYIGGDYGKNGAGKGGSHPPIEPDADGTVKWR